LHSGKVAFERKPEIIPTFDFSDVSDSGLTNLKEHQCRQVDCPGDAVVNQLLFHQEVC
jgi:hypothetical protein